MIWGRHCKGVAAVSLTLLLAGCGGGSGNSEDGHIVRVGTLCEAEAGPEFDMVGCPGSRISPEGLVEVDDGDQLKFHIPQDPDRMTHVESNCGIRTPLDNSRTYNDPSASPELGYEAKSGDLAGDSLSVGPVSRDCDVTIFFLTTIEINTKPGAHGDISPVHRTVNARSLSRFKLSADDGYVVSGVDGCDGEGSLEGNVYTLANANADCVLSVSYLEIPDMAGIWSGTWEGIDSVFGPVAGTWVTRMSQDNIELSGLIEFSGDLDCAEGDMTGAVDPRAGTITGEVQRFPSPNPCPANSWLFTAFDEQATSASGSWRKSGLSNGAFEGRRIATLDGPRLQSFYPPWAGPGAYVTIRGENIDMDLVNDSLTLGFGGLPLLPETVTESMIRLRLPDTVSGSEQLHLTTLEGTAMSALPLNTSVTGPATGYTQIISLVGTNPKPSGLVFSVNNRRAFSANRGTGAVSMINTDQSLEFTSTTVIGRGKLPVALHAVAAHPAGRSIYAAGDGVVGILHAHTLQLLDTLDLPAYGGAQGNPHGITISPDGRWLLVSEAAVRGRVSIVDTNDHVVANTLTMPAGSTPGAVVVSPDNRHAYVALSGISNEILVYDLVAGMAMPAINIGGSPASLAVTPDARHILVGSADEDTVYVHDLMNSVTEVYRLGMGVLPSALAVTPDGAKVFVSSNSSQVYIIEIETGVMISVPVGGPSAAIAISRDGRRAYVAQSQFNRIVEIGNQRTLRISKQGGGLGSVRSQPVAINCGTECSATFSLGTQVNLDYSIPPGFRFGGWSGDSDCRDGRISMQANRYCVARFEKIPPPPPPPRSSGSSGGSSDCFIATAAYGSWLDPHVMTLRIFRDEHLLTNAVGSRLVEIYYAKSPPIADYIRERESLRAVVRGLLAMVVYAIENPQATVLGLWLVLLLRYRRRQQRRQQILQAG